MLATPRQLMATECTTTYAFDSSLSLSDLGLLWQVVLDVNRMAHGPHGDVTRQAECGLSSHTRAVVSPPGVALSQPCAGSDKSQELQHHKAHNLLD